MIRDIHATLYSDSDGVICDFHKAATKILGRRFDHKIREADGEQINQVHDFWETLPLMPDFHAYWKVISKYHPHILTAVPSAPWKIKWGEVERGKREWYRKHLPEIPQLHIHVVERNQKQEYAKSGSTRNILIDDHLDNIQEWVAAGGHGIHHVSAKATIIQLKELGYF